MDDKHLNPITDAEEANASQDMVDPTTPVDSFQMPASVFGGRDSIVRPAPPSKEKLQSYLDAMTATPLTEKEVFEMAAKEIPDYAAQDAAREANPEPEPVISPMAPLLNHLGVTDAGDALSNDPRFDTELTIHNPASAAEIFNTTNLTREDLAAATETVTPPVVTPAEPEVEAVIVGPKVKSLQVNMTKKTTPLMHAEETPVHGISVEDWDTVATTTAPIGDTEQSGILVNTIPAPGNIDQESAKPTTRDGVPISLLNALSEDDPESTKEVTQSEPEVTEVISEDIPAQPEVPVVEAGDAQTVVEMELEPLPAEVSGIEQSEEVAPEVIPQVVMEDGKPVAVETTATVAPTTAPTPPLVSPQAQTASMVDHLIGTGGGAEFMEALNEIPTVVKDSTSDDLMEIKPEEVSQEEETPVTISIDDAVDLVVATTSSMVFERNFDVYPDRDELIKLRSGENEGNLVIPLMNLDTLNELYVQTSPQLLEGTNREMFGGEPAIGNQITQKNVELQGTINDPSSYLYRIHAAREFFTTETSGFQRDILKTAFESHKQKTGKDLAVSRAVKVKDIKQDQVVMVDDKVSDKDGFIAKLKDRSVLNGSTAFKAASMLINGLRKVNLYNSGFFVVLSAARLDILTKYANSARTNLGDYGRMLGKLAFIPAGVEIRAALFDLIESIAVDSNLEGWDQPGVLRSAISSLDYNTLIWGAASLMYPRGVDIEYVCYNNLPAVEGKDPVQCHRIEKAKIDVGNMRYNNWSLLCAEAILYVDSKTKRTPADVKAYREKYLQDVEEVVTISEDGAWKAHLSIPTIAEAEESQRAYVAELLTVVQTGKPSEINQYIRAKYLNSFVPYVRKISYVDPKLQKEIIFNDGAALANALDNLQLAPNITLGDKIVDFIASKTVTHICFTHHPCPKCGQYPKDAVSRLIACDPEFAFFQWAIFQLP